MSITYPQFPDTKFPDELDNFQRFIDITLDTYALAKEFESKFQSGDIAGAYALLEENPQLKRSYIGAATLNPIIDAINALQLLFTESIQEYLMNIVKPQGGYSPTVKYKKYDVVLYANNSALETYMCFRNDTPIGTLPTNTNYWWPLTLRGERGLPGTGLVPYGIWSPYITYPKDALVTYNNILWASSEENTNVIPSINSSVWYKILEINVNDLTYIDSTTNIPYRYIIDDGRVYFENIIDNTRFEIAKIIDIPEVIPIERGGTGASNAAQALKNLGIEATATEINKLKGTTVSSQEINYLNGVTGNIQSQLNNKAQKSTVTNVTLSASQWSGSSAPYTYTLSINGVTSNNVIEIIPQNNLDVNQVKNLADAMIVTGTQSTNSITLKAYGNKPTVNIPITIIIRGDL